MGIYEIANKFCNWMNKINPQSEDENKVIQYGIELLLDNIIKFSMIQFMGILIGKGIETFIVLFSFCGLRLHAGGKHAQTGIGCGLSMIIIWSVCMIANMTVRISIPFFICTYAMCVVIIWFCAPRTINIDYFSIESRNRKKICSITFLTVISFIAILCSEIRGLIIYPVIIEVLSLLPKNKVKEKEENEKRNNY